MPFAIIGIFLLMSVVDGKALIRDRDLMQWLVYLALTVISSSVLMVYSVTFTKPNILAYLETWLRPVSRWLTG
jgi:hypothetical protein